MSTVLVQMRALSLELEGRRLLGELTCSVGPGERLGITGPSGCGKTTLLRRLVARSLGQGSHSGTVQFGEALRAARIGYVPQARGLFPWLTLRRSLEALAPATHTPALVTARTQSVLEAFELIDAADRFPDQLSGGEAQRAQLACALVVDPVLYVVDEPLTEVSLDQKWRVLRRWSAEMIETNAALIVVSHDVDTLLLMTDRIIAMTGRPASPSIEIVVASSHPRDPRELVGPSMAAPRERLLKTVMPS